MVSEGEEGNKLFAHLPVFICQASFLSHYLRTPASNTLIFLWLKNKTMGWLLQQYHLFVFLSSLQHSQKIMDTSFIQALNDHI